MDTFHPDIIRALREREPTSHPTTDHDTSLWFRKQADALLTPPTRKELPPLVQEIARAIDHTYLQITPDNPDHDRHEILRICREAATYGFAAVCVRPHHVALARALFHSWGREDTAVCTVIDFPRTRGERGGAASPDAKEQEALKAQREGATEFDVVIDTDALLFHQYLRAYEGIAAVSSAMKAADAGAIVKVILETAALRTHGGPFVLHTGCDAAIDGGADFLKTSTGYAPEGGATEEDVQFLVESASPRGVLVKASGGIRTLDQLLALRTAGAARFGLSASVPVLEEALKRGTRD